MKLHFKELGKVDKPPLVMLHGLFGSSDNWMGVGSRLGCHCYALDLRNHGLSPHSEVMDYTVMAEDVAEFFETHQLGRAHVLGHSMGGKVAMQLALRHPERVEKLVVVDMAPRPYSAEHVPIFKALLGLNLKRYPSRREIEDALEPEIPDLTLRRFLLKNLSHESPGGSETIESRVFKWKIPLEAIYASYPRLCEAIQSDHSFEHPALFLHGGQSPYVTIADAPQIGKLFPNLQFATIPQARHWVHADAPDEFVRRVSTFLA
jgi:pimeloyl-ACP methyl ester carboxylesterase